MTTHSLPALIFRGCDCERQSTKYGKPNINSIKACLVVCSAEEMQTVKENMNHSSDPLAYAGQSLRCDNTSHSCQNNKLTV